MDFCNLWFQFGWWKFMSDRYTMAQAHSMTARKWAIEEHKDVDSGEANRIQGLQEPFIQHEKDAAACKDVESNTTVENGSIGMVLLLFVVGYSAPTQAAIREDLNLSLAEDPYSLDLGRFFTGYGIGVISFVLMIVIGSSISFLLGSFLSWRQLALAGLVPCISLLIGLHFIPESPRWLDYIETLQSLPKTKFLALFQSKHVRSVVIGVGLMVCQQSVGINGLSSGKIGSIAYACMQVPFTVLGAMLMDKSGRRPLIMDQSLLLDCVPILAVASVLIYVGAFSIGMGPVPWVIMSEIFLIHVKGTAGSLVVLVNWLGAWVVSYTFNFLMSWSSLGNNW
ncbi:hypothetical protein JHK86_019833 [Glycine max]|nr:hypothetical protein JHK86_019833 [Glycine max]